MNHSIITEYQQDLHQFSPAALGSNSLVSKSADNQKDDFYITKLEAKVKQIRNSIKKNKPLIQQMKAQRKFMKKIYEKQKQKIEGTKLDLIKLEYENQIQMLRQQHHKLQDVISVIHEESSGKAKQYVQAKQQINQNYFQFTRALQQVRNQNKMYEQMLINKKQAIQLKKKQIAEINQEIKGKLNVEKKYREVMNQIQVLENQKKAK